MGSYTKKNNNKLISSKFQPALEKSWNLPDTCGIHNLHGIPGVLGAVISVIMAAIATEKTYYKSLYDMYPARASPTMAPTPDYHITPGLGRSAGQQAGYQVISLLVTLAVAAVSGFITGKIWATSRGARVMGRWLANVKFDEKVDASFFLGYYVDVEK